MTSYVDFDAHVPGAHLPALSSLIRKLAKNAGIGYVDAVERYDARPQGCGRLNDTLAYSSTLAQYRMVIRDGRTKDATMIGVWAQLIENGAITIRELYDSPVPVIMPDDFKVIPNVSWAWNTERNASTRINTSKFATYSIMGIDKNDWEGWGNNLSFDAPPHMIYRYMQICAQYGIPMITPEQYLKFAYALSTIGGRRSLYSRITGNPTTIPLTAMQDWASTARSLNRAGHGHSRIENLGEWVVDDGWSIESMAILAVANIEVSVANRLWNNGLQDAELIRMHLIEGVPLEWVEGMFAQRKSALN